MTPQRIAVSGQLSIFNYLPIEAQPELWECQKTCKRFGEKTGFFPTGEKRCEIPFDGSLRERIDDGSVVHFFCKAYEI